VRLVRLSNLVLVLVVCLALLGCQCSSDSGPVRILNPSSGDKLVVGESFLVSAQVETNYEIESVNIELWDVSTGYKHNWLFDNSLLSEAFRFTKTLVVPEAAPIGDDYRLMVNVVSTSDNRSGVGYSLLVKVTAAS
jgi:hypothetical protein